MEGSFSHIRIYFAHNWRKNGTATRMRQAYLNELP